MNRGDVCQTCKLSSFDCPGHFGHIELPVPVFNPLFMVQAFQLLRGTCSYCHKFLVKDVVILRYIAKLTLLEHGLASASDAVDDIASPSTSKKAKASGRKSSKKQNEETLSDQEIGGESTREPGEPAEEDDEDDDIGDYKMRLDKWVEYSIVSAKRSATGGMGEYGRDEYKNSGICFDRRKKVVAEFLKALPKKTCGRCGALVPLSLFLVFSRPTLANATLYHTVEHID